MMTVKKILSPQNEYLKKIGKLKQRKYRDAFGLFVTEGERACREAADSGFIIESMILSESYYDRHKQAFCDIDRVITADRCFAALCGTKTPQGVLAVVRIPEQPKMLCGGKYVYLDRIQDPGNAGTIIRSADAFGFDGILCSPESVDVYSPKVIRSAMGSVFHLTMMPEASPFFLEQAKQNGYFITASALYGASVDIRHMQVREKQIFVIGNEGNGVSDQVLKLADEIVHIPMGGAAESLNAGVAASILMYEVSGHEPVYASSL